MIPTASVRLSLQSVASRLSPVSDLTPARPSAASVNHGPVLLLDDDRLSGRGTARYIRGRCGIEVVVARTLHQAQCLLRFGPPPSAIVTDFELQTPETGVDFIVSCRRFRRVPAVVFTGAPQAARAALDSARLSHEVPVLGRQSGLELLGAWLCDMSEPCRQHAVGA